MSSIGTIDKVEEILVLRVDHNSTILEILYHNKHFSRLANKISGKTLQDVGLKQKDCEQCAAYLRKVFVNLEKEVFQLQIKNRYYQISYLPEWKARRQVETVLIIVQDTTKCKKMNVELTEIREKLQIANQLLMAKQMSTNMAGEMAKVGYFQWEQIGNDLYWSDQQYRNFGYAPQEFTPTLELFHGLVYSEDVHIVRAALAELDVKPYVESQFRIIKADGSLVWLHFRINAITNEGSCSKIFGITQDITAYKQAEKQIHSVEKELAFTNQLYSRSTYLNKLLFNDYPVERITTALNDFSIETQVPHCCFLLQLVENVAYNTENLADVTIPPRTRKQAVLIWLAEREWGLVWRCHEHIVLLTSIVDQLVASKHSQLQFAHDMIVELEMEFPHFYVKMGISGISNIPINFREIYEKAQRAVVIAESKDHSAAIHCDDIGLYEVAFQLLEDKNTCAIVQNTIGRLAEYDEVRGSNLLITLECILEYGSIKTVAQQLFIHQNTVIWRKRKIEDFLEMPFDKMETKMLLLLYVKIWKLKQNAV